MTTKSPTAMCRALTTGYREALIQAPIKQMSVQRPSIATPAQITVVAQQSPLRLAEKEGGPHCGSKQEREKG